MPQHQRVASLKELPPLSTSAARILEAVNDADIELERLAGIIEQGPNISARILTLANSSYFGRSGTVTTVRDATVRVLGLNTVKSLATAYAIGATFDMQACPSFDGARYWTCALLAGCLAQHLCQQVRVRNRPDPGTCYSAALLANIGLMALAHVFPEGTNRALQEHQDQPGDQTLQHFLRQELETDQYQAGSWLARRWNLPDVLTLSIQHQADPTYRQAHWSSVQVVGISVAVAPDLMKWAEVRRNLDLPLRLLGTSQENWQLAVDNCLQRRDELLEMAATVAG